MPYLFADCWRLTRDRIEPGVAPAVNTSGLPFRAYLVIIGTIPMVGLFWGFQTVQKLYTVTGAMFFPFLALALLIWNGRSDWIGAEFRNRPATTVALAGVLLFFSWLGVRSVL